MINIEDRVVQFPNRYQLVLVSGTTDTYDLIEVPGTETAEGTDVNRTALMALQGFCANETVFNSDGSITETNADLDTKVTVFNSDGSITETFTSDGISIAKQTTFNADGSISEVMI